MCLDLDQEPVRGVMPDRVETRRLDSCLTEHTATAHLPGGLLLTVRRRDFQDFPVTEYEASLENTSAGDSPRVRGFSVCAFLPWERASLLHGNGDTLRPDGYSWQTDAIPDEPLSLSPTDGTSCNGAFPYMRLRAGDAGVNLAIGWPTCWQAAFAKARGGIFLRVGQKRCDTLLHPGERLCTPTLTLMPFTGDEDHARNLWRRWYLRHILPRREAGQPLPPQLCMHRFAEGGHPEFTGATEAGQVEAIRAYDRMGIRPDVWWIDAGWYPCAYEWTRTGTWRADEARFPRGLKPVAGACGEIGARLMLWFEPERVREGTSLDREHPEWLLTRRLPDGSTDRNRLLNLGDPACCDALIRHVSGLIDAWGVSVYRQDFNFDPAPFWQEHEAEDRMGALENFHAQGYLRYWDALLARHPGLLIDSCASGGRRNDLSTMRRAVPFHYTDVGYGNHPIKQKQHRQMFEWIPFFRAHNMNWLQEDGAYGRENRPADRFAYHAAMAPALTEMLPFDAPPEQAALAREMLPIWRGAAGLMLRGDYYPLTECRASETDFYAMQFHDPDRDEGFAQVMSNPQNPETRFTLALRGLTPGARYRFTDPETGEGFEASAGALAEGMQVELPAHSARLWFYERKRDV